jgi:2',3'-cyclic-nucleotide 2'-phosphodiesterase (5'-nucleotidase family)
LNVRRTVKTALAAAAASLALCGAAEESAGRELVIIYTGDSGAEVESCGCNALAYGGLARRASLVNALRAACPDAVFVDTGDFVSPTVGVQDQLKSEITAEAYGQFGYDAVNVGEDDFNYGVDFLEDLVSEYGIPAISANVAVAGEPFAPAYAVVERGGYSVGIVGFVNAELAAGKDLGSAEIGDYKKAVKKAAGELAGRVDLIICLAHVGNVDKARDFARGCPKEIAVVIGGHRGGRTPDAEEVKGRWVVYTRSRNRYVGMLKLTLDEGGKVIAATNTVLPVTKETAKDEETQKLVDKYYAELRRLVEEKKLLKPPEDIPPDGFLYVGGGTCAQCHPGPTQQWHGTAHAAAYDSLVEVGREQDPECVACHVTGYGYRGGFLWTTDPPTAAGVGCEECHGPGEGHAGTPALHPAAVTEATCVKCHDAERSPAFDYQTYLGPVSH